MDRSGRYEASEPINCRVSVTWPLDIRPSDGVGRVLTWHVHSVGLVEMASGDLLGLS